MVSQGVSDMTPTLLILGGTTEASDLARAVADRGINAIFSYAGRVARPREQPIETRVGGFGGVDGLVAYLTANIITHVIDATHPFAQGMSRNAAIACARAGVPLAALSRPAWQRINGDQWREVADIDAAVQALQGPAQRVFLALGRMHLEAFTAQPQHHYLLRLVDAPDREPLPDCEVIVARGPFDLDGDIALMRRHGTQLVVCKNAGGVGARAKLDAARHLGLPVLMIARPELPERQEFARVDQVLDWLSHAGTDLGV
jgi:precorrin-6A/cobalt-precorrin-6A reductase